MKVGPGEITFWKSVALHTITFNKCSCAHWGRLQNIIEDCKIFNFMSPLAHCSWIYSGYFIDLFELSSFGMYNVMILTVVSYCGVFHFRLFGLIVSHELT